MPKLIAMLRVKDGILFVEKWLENMDKLVDEIVVVDNGSTDGTYEILKKHSKVVAIERTEGFHEGRDKILAYELTRKCKPDWILWLDVDEVFEDRVTRDKLNKMMKSRMFTRYFFRRFHFHKDEKHVEASYDKLLAICTPDRVLWKEQSGGYFRNLKIHNGLICGIKGLYKVSPFRIKHIGNVNKEYLERKTDIYLSIDPERSDMYIKHRDQDVKTLRWYEYDKNPIPVIFINIFLTLLMMKKLSIYAIKKLIGILK